VPTTGSPTAADELAVPSRALADRLVRSVLLSSVAGACGMVGVALVYVLVLASPWLLVILVACVAHQATLVVVRRTCRRGDLARAAVMFCVADWTIVLVSLAIVPPVAAALVPIIIARIVSTLPYLERPALLRLVVASLGAGVAVGALSRVDVIGVSDRVPDWVVTAFVMFFVPVGIVIVGLDLWQHSATLLENVDRAVRANARLQASERTLAEQAQELRRSRARLVVAADEERRRVERDFHDGAQQTLIGLCLGLTSLADRQPAGSVVRVELDRLGGYAQDTLTEIRELAHGVYPPVLAAHGLAPALAAVLRRLQLPVHAAIETVGRRPPEQEAAVYFACREALQNVEKHAGPDAAVELTLSEDALGGLQFCVLDSGRGFDTATAGHGLVNMGDRLAAVGGSLEVSSSRGGGTRVTGVIPAGAGRGPDPDPVLTSGSVT
jgi:signal transduction histidine kinase